MTVLAVVTAGRALFEVSTSTLPGWTALFFLALLLGLIVANTSSEYAFVSGLQKASLLMGAIVSLIATLLLQYQLDSAGEALLFIAAFCLMAGVAHLQRHKPLNENLQDKYLARWALRLDGLLKYELPQRIRGQIIQLIDQLWQSPQEQAEFIPAQNEQISLLLDALESSTREKTLYSAEEMIRALAQHLEERNQLILKNVEIKYRTISKQTRLLTSDSDSNSKSLFD